YINKEAIAKEEKRLIYSIRYQAYLGNNSIKKQENPFFQDKYDQKDNCRPYLCYLNKKPISSIRSCIYLPEKSWLEIPALDVFPEEIEKHIGLNKIFVESNKFTLLPGYQNKQIMNMICLFKNIMKNAIEYKADYIITAVRARHIRFYEKMFFSPISEEKSYPHLNFKTVLLSCDFRRYYEQFYEESKRNIFKVMFE
ncbi:hypothetical protein ACFL2K_03545, partial [Candidatus Margulisiibacteriota bacterium]